MTSLDYFENPYEDWKDGGFSVDESYIRSLIYEYVRKIVDETFPMNSRQKYRNPNLFVGNAGIAFMFLKIYTSRCNFSDLKPEYYATEYIEDAKRNISPNHRHIYKAPQCSLLTGTAGIFCVSAAISSVLHKDLTMWSDLTNFYLGYEKCQKIDFIPHGRDEMLVGRAGYLSGMHFLNKQIKPKRYTDDEILNLCKVIIDSGRSYSKIKKSIFPLAYPFHASEYLGALHGLSSILLMILNSPWFQRTPLVKELTNAPTDILNDVKGTIDLLLSLQDEEGNFPTAADDAQENIRQPPLIQWCHGSPGIIYLLIKAYKVFKEEKYLNAARKVADVIWRCGLLTAGPSLCHGVAGNGYAFLMMFRATGEVQYVYRAFKFAEFLKHPHFTVWRRNDETVYGLYEGLAGVVCYLIDLLEPSKAEFPFMCMK